VGQIKENEAALSPENQEVLNGVSKKITELNIERAETNDVRRRDILANMLLAHNIYKDSISEKKSYYFLFFSSAVELGLSREKRWTIPFGEECRVFRNTLNHAKNCMEIF